MRLGSGYLSAVADAPAIEAIFPQWEVVRFLTAHIAWPYPKGETEIFLRNVALPAIRAGCEWQCSIRWRAAPETLIGIMHLRDGEEDNRGFWIDPTWHGQGFATEACVAATEYWFGALGRTVLRAPKATGNIASRRISEKTGMRLIRVEERDYVSGRLPAEIWEITAQAWRSACSDPIPIERRGPKQDKSP